MTGNKCLLDTSIVIHLFKNTDQLIRLNSFDEVYVNSVVIGELYYGAYASANPQKHINQIQLFLDNCLIVYVSTDTALIYARLKAELRKNGTPIPENDIWIAASAIEHALSLFTIDNHFTSLKLNLIQL